MENTKSKHKKVGVDIFVSDQVVQEKKTWPMIKRDIS